MWDRRQRFWLEGDAIELVPAHSASEAERARALSTGNARWKVQQAQHSEGAFSGQSLFDYAENQRYGGAPPSAWETRSSLDDALLRAIDDGSLLVVPDPPFVPPPRRSRDAKNTPHKAETPLEAQELAWIELELLDEDGDPCPRVRYVVISPTGVRKEGRLDSKGRARIEGILAGQCEIKFPDLRDRAWR